MDAALKAVGKSSGQPCLGSPFLLAFVHRTIEGWGSRTGLPCESGIAVAGVIQFLANR